MPGETVRDVSFEVKKGEIFGIGGLAGHGKLGIPNGIMGLYPAGGRVRVFGKTLTVIGDFDKNICILCEKVVYLQFDSLILLTIINYK